MITIKIKVGNSQLEYQAEDVKKIHKFASVYGALPEKCECCGSPALYLFHKAPKENDYFGVKCKACGAELTFHQKKEGGFYVKHDDKMQKYSGGGEQSAKKQEPEEVPF